MKPLLIKILIGVVGFGGGFAAGFYTHKKMNNLQFEEISEEEMSKIAEKDAEKEKKDIEIEVDAKKDAGKGTDGYVSEDLGAAQKLPEEADDIRNVLQGKIRFIDADNEQKTAYEKLWKATKAYSNEENANDIPVFTTSTQNKVKQEDVDEAEEEYPEEEEFDGEFLEQLEQEAAEAGNNFTDPPHQIDLVSFYSDHPEYDSVTIKWYDEDNTWIDDNEEIIPDISSYTEIDFKNPFDEEPMTDDPDVRFWVNDRIQTNYEFVRHHRSYRETKGE